MTGFAVQLVRQAVFVATTLDRDKLHDVLDQAVIAIDERDLERSRRDPRVRAFHESADRLLAELREQDRGLRAVVHPTELRPILAAERDLRGTEGVDACDPAVAEAHVPAPWARAAARGDSSRHGKPSRRIRHYAPGCIELVRGYTRITD
jgi:hypothetical protein